MRKDVKFGLTIGAILVVTLVVYVIVLSRGPANPGKIAIATPSQSDQSNEATGSDATDDSTGSATPQSDTAAKPDDDSDVTPPITGNKDATTPPAVASNPATQPAPVAQANSDWDGALNHGLPAVMSAPERTVTPTIDSTSANLSQVGIARSANTPMIDPLPSTQPSRPMMADVPALDAQAPPTPASSPSQYSYSAPSYTSATPSYASATPAQPISNTPRSHRVVSGDSPYSISVEVYGSGRYYKRILAANPGIDPRHLKVGQLLVIPELNDTDRPASSSSTNSAAVSEPVNTSTAYKVVSGDTLESISQKLYGTPQMVEKLYQANKSLIGPDENVLKIGWILKLPEAPTAGSAQR